MSVASPTGKPKEQSSLVNDANSEPVELTPSENEGFPRTQSRLTSVCAFATMTMLWFSFPPVGVSWLAWIAPVPLIWLCSLRQLPGRRPYLVLWLAGFAYWLATFYFIPIPHWALWFGWLTISAYLAFYTMLVVGSTRGLVHGLRLPIWIAAPVAWTGVEWMRCNFLTGMGMVCLSHSQYQQPIVIQVADIFGSYTLTFLMVIFAASLIGLPILTSCCERKTSWVHVLTAASSVAFVFGYGQFRLGEDVKMDESGGLNIVMIQGSVDTNLYDRENERLQKYEQCRDLTLQARREYPEADLILWPEANFPIYDVIPQNGVTPKMFSSYNAQEETSMIWQDATGFPVQFSEPVSMLVGTFGSYQGDDGYNSAVLISEAGEVTARYFKNHRVMFGEYFPILEWIPAFAKRFPNMAAGTEPTSIQLNGVRLAPTICFETTVPHFIRRQINKLTIEDQQPDAIVNLTNDGWFYGTSCLDFHLACNVFRAVEMRKTNLVCANTGLSAEINSSGRIIQQGVRRKTQILPATLHPEARSSMYRTLGDWIPLGMSAACVFGLAVFWRKR